VCAVTIFSTVGYEPAVTATVKPVTAIRGKPRVAIMNARRVAAPA
jgi:hypothetical protein